MATYEAAPVEVLDFIGKIKAERYHELADSEVTIGAIFARPAAENLGDTGRKLKFAMKADGFRIYSKVKINGLADRVEGKPDATFILDGDFWEELGEDFEAGDRRREAMIEECLHTLTCKRKDGTVLEDDAGRPKLEKRPKDYRVEGYRAIAERHHQFAPSVVVARQFNDEFGNLLFDFASDLAVSDYPEVIAAAPEEQVEKKKPGRPKKDPAEKKPAAEKKAPGKKPGGKKSTRAKVAPPEMLI